jgi:hypothetical protein
VFENKELKRIFGPKKDEVSNLYYIMKNFWPLFLRPYNLKEHKVNKHNEQAA